LGDESLVKRLANIEKKLKDIQEKENKQKPDSAFTVTPCGRLSLDTANFNQDATDRLRGDEKNATGIRSARLGVSGSGFDVIKYQVEFDFAPSPTGNASDAGDDSSNTSGKVRCKSSYITITSLPLMQNIQVGYFKEPFSLERLINDNYITFMQRSVATSALAPGRHLGVMMFGDSDSENATYALGCFCEHDDALVQSDHAGADCTGRVTWLPYYDEATNGRGLIHTGLSYSYHSPYKNEYEVEYRPESYFALKNKSSTLTDVQDRHEIGVELANVYGPLSIQAEYYVNFIERTSYADCDAQGAYACVSYFLTGENRPYKRSRGVFERVRPYENFFRVRDENDSISTGKGAWELKYRYSWLDAYDNGNLGFQTCHDHTVGVNWYLNPYTRFMFEYIHSGINQNQGSGVGSLDIFQARAQIDF
jgi:phosphate-selective porin OprO and OprP